MPDPYQLDVSEEEAFRRILTANPLKGDDLGIFVTEARHHIKRAQHRVESPEKLSRERADVLDIHFLTKGIRGFVAGALLGLSLGATVIDNPDPVARFWMPAGMMGIVICFVDVLQFRVRAQRAVPEFWRLNDYV